MARRQVVEIKCDRCDRVENQEGTAIPTGMDDELTVTFHGKSIKYHDLCKRCRDACENYFKAMIKQAEPAKKEGSPAPVSPPVPEKSSGFLGIGKRG